jgi:hypothetical protein
MARSTVVRYQTLPEAADENRRLVERVYAELGERRPAGLRYATFGLADGVSFVHVAVHEGDDDPLPGLPAFQEFQRGISGRVLAPPVVSGAELIGSYRLIS